MANTAGFAALDRMISAIEALPRDLVKQSVPEIARVAKAEVSANVAAGHAPDGTAWKPTKEGKRALQNAAAHVTATAIDTAIIFEVSGVEAKHHKGRAKGGERRPIIPVRSIPQPLNVAIKKVLGKHFRQIVSGP